MNRRSFIGRLGAAVAAGIGALLNKELPSHSPPPPAPMQPDYFWQSPTDQPFGISYTPWTTATSDNTTTFSVSFELLEDVPMKC